MNQLALDLMRLSEHMADVATQLRAVGKSVELESHADELMSEAGALAVLAGKVAAGTVAR